MVLEFIEELPSVNRGKYGYTKNMIEDFLGSGHRYARIDNDDGRSNKSLYQAFLGCIRRNVELSDRVSVHSIDGNVYLERIDD